MSYTLPSYFSAIDKFSGPLKSMKAAMGGFTSEVDSGTVIIQRRFNNFATKFAEVGKISAVASAAILTPLAMAVKEAAKYEDALASFRTIVSDLNDIQFSSYKKEIESIANATNKSFIDVAQSFEKIAGLNASFAKTPEALGQVTQSVITLAKASKMELGDSASSLVGIMNQYSMQALEANKAINILAAGQAVGAASIQQTAESFVNFGSVAKGANISLEQSVGLIQTMGKYSLFGAEAGTKLRGSVLKLQQAGVGYKSGQFEVIAALQETTKNLAHLKSAKEKDALLTKVFGAENIAAGKILIDNIATIQQYTAGVTGTSEAQRAAAINGATMQQKINDLKATLGNMAITIGEVLLPAVKSFIDMVSPVVKAVTDWMREHKELTKFIVIASGIIGGFLGVLALLAGAIWAVNVALIANPIGLFVLAIGGLIALVAAVIIKWDEWGAALTFFMGPIGWVIRGIQSIRKNWHLVSEGFKTDGIWGALKGIGKLLLDVILYPLQQILSIVGDLTGFKWAKNGADAIKMMRQAMGTEEIVLKGVAPSAKTLEMIQGFGMIPRAAPEQSSPMLPPIQKLTPYYPNESRMQAAKLPQQEVVVKLIAPEGHGAEVVSHKNMTKPTITQSKRSL